MFFYVSNSDHKKNPDCICFLDPKGLVEHHPKALEPSHLGWIESPCVEDEICQLKMDKSFYMAGENCLLSSMQLKALCLMIKAHGELYESTVEVYNTFKTKDGIKNNAAAAVATSEDLLSPSFDKVGMYVEDPRVSGVKVCSVRKGFYLADSPGFGKLRTLAALVAEYRALGVLQTLFVTERECSYTLVLEEILKFFPQGVVYTTFDKYGHVRKEKTGQVQVQTVPEIIVVTYGFLENLNTFNTLCNLLGGENYEGLVRHLNTFSYQL